MKGPAETVAPVNLFRDLDRLPEQFRQGAVSIGNFDGVHRGHAQIARRLAALARHVRGPAVVFTFDPHPARILRPEAVPARMVWTDRKVQLLGELGVDAVVAFPTDPAFLELDARQFFERVVRGGLAAQAMVEGPNFFFGRNRSGNIDVLRSFCAEARMTLEVVQPVEIDGVIVSSSRIRTEIAAGRVDRARALLGRPYRLRGRVVLGQQRGTKLGFPTANIGQVNTLLPGEGIYAGVASTPEDGASWPAAVSVGPNPTFNEMTSKVEAYLIGFEGSLYDHTIELDFFARLRDIERFDGPKKLVAQMEQDVAAAREIIEQHLRREE